MDTPTESSLLLFPCAVLGVEPRALHMRQSYTTVEELFLTCTFNCVEGVLPTCLYVHCILTWCPQRSEYRMGVSHCEGSGSWTMCSWWLSYLSSPLDGDLNDLVYSIVLRACAFERHSHSYLVSYGLNELGLNSWSHKPQGGLCIRIHRCLRNRRMIWGQDSYGLHGHIFVQHRNLSTIWIYSNAGNQLWVANDAGFYCSLFFAFVFFLSRGHILP